MKTKLASVQILRALAASMVVFYHFALVGARYHHTSSWIVTSGLGALGEAGVDLFFVLSGFVMFYTAGEMVGSAAAFQFLKKRVLRIYPVYWVWTAVLFVFWKKHFALTSHAYSTGFLIKSYLLIPASNGGDLHPFLNQGWTLTFEMLFYLLFAAAIACGFGKVRSVVVIGLIVGCYCAGFVFASDGVARQILTNTLVFEFAFGVIAGVICLRLNASKDGATQSSIAKRCLVGGSMLLVCSMVLYVTDANRTIFYGLPSFCIVLGAALWRDRTYHPYLVFLGDASYSIYLIHGMVVMAFGTLLKHGGMLQRDSLDVLIVGGTVLTVPLTALGYVLVERPMLKRLGLMASAVREPVKEGMAVGVVAG